jgi:hypothetical protein
VIGFNLGRGVADQEVCAGSSVTGKCTRSKLHDIEQEVKGESAAMPSKPVKALRKGAEGSAMR